VGEFETGPSQNEAAFESLPNEPGELTNTDWDVETNGDHDEIQAMMIVGFKIFLSMARAEKTGRRYTVAWVIRGLCK
jgi:hypothetical protein